MSMRAISMRRAYRCTDPRTRELREARLLVDGSGVGLRVGTCDGLVEGAGVGSADGDGVGRNVGLGEGARVGRGVG